MTLRLQGWSAARDANGALVRLSEAVSKRGLDKRVLHLVNPRVSQTKFRREPPPLEIHTR